jgi:hypothetical protein
VVDQVVKHLVVQVAVEIGIHLVDLEVQAVLP